MIVRRFRITILKLNSKYRLFYQDFYFILFFLHFQRSVHSLFGPLSYLINIC